MENNLNENNAVETTTPHGTFTHKIGNTTYVVGVHFSKTSKETIDDKMKRLILSDLEHIKP
jgi:hypothetical protein